MLFDLTPNSNGKIIRNVWQTVLKIDVSILRVKVKALYLWWCLLYFGMHHIPGKENKNIKTLFNEFLCY